MTKTSIFASFALLDLAAAAAFGLAAAASSGAAAAASSGLAAASEVQIAASDDCRARCQAIENQCRMTSKDLDSSKCAAKFLACIQSCRK